MSKLHLTPQQTHVVSHIAAHKFITSFDAYRLYGITQLGTRIFELKAKGYRFRNTRVDAVNRFGRPTHFDQYRIVGRP
jgi:hypothetical protein